MHRIQFIHPRVVARLAIAALLAFSALTVTAGASAAPTPDGTININEASAEQLSWLPGIGKSKAERIVAYRTKRPFKTVEQLARVKGIGLKTVRKLKPMLRVKGPTTLAKPAKKKRARSTGSSRAK